MVSLIIKRDSDAPPFRRASPWPSRPFWWDAPTIPVLDSNSIHVWRAPLTPPQNIVERLSATLSDEERSRAARFRFERDRRRFVVARGILRDILGRYLDAEPRDIEFRTTPHGKPLLAGPIQRTVAPLCFNIAHSDDLALYAFHTKAIGVDLERVRPIPDLRILVSRVLSSREQAALEQLTLDSRLKAFLSCWTGKEAYAKATGLGLSLQLPMIETLPLEEGGACTVVSNDGRDQSGSWVLARFTPAPHYVAAVVFGSAGASEFWQWTSGKVLAEALPCAVGGPA